MYTSRIGGCLPKFPIRLEDGWSDDSQDPDYNKLVDRPSSYSSESLWLPSKLYDLIVVLDFNRTLSRVGRGSAIFLHVMDRLGRNTAGCIAFSRRDLLVILNGWRPASRVVIAGGCFQAGCL